jgi:protein-S-isoprenylcysteine O-methyltransferase Ste14
MTQMRKGKLYDLLAVSPLIGWYALGISMQAPKIGLEAEAIGRHPSMAAILELASLGTTLAFLGLQIVLFLIRRVPEAHSEGIRPRLAALVGANIQLSFLALPRMSGNVAIEAIATTLITIGMIGSVTAAWWLGRSFSVFPQARRLVVSGPYRYVRHPLYLAEQVAGLGVILQYAQPWSALIGAASLAAQFPRMHYEEKILANAYPEYRDYAARTSRLVPFLY